MKLPGLRALRRGLTTPRDALGPFSGAIAVGVGFLVLFGWATDIASLKSVLPGLVAMKPNTAVALALAGVSLWALRSSG